MALLTLEQIRDEIERRAPLIGATGDLLPTYGRTEDFARPHIEVDAQQYHFVVVERGEELARVSTTELDELLYRVFEAATFSLACRYELRHRKPLEDSRRQLFRVQVELLAKLDARWGERRAEAHRLTLLQHPFSD